MDTGTAIAIVAILVSIILPLYIFRYQVKTDQAKKDKEYENRFTKLEGVTATLQKYPPGEMATKVDLLWEIYAVDALHDKPNLAHSQSPLSITAEGVAEIPKHIRIALDRLPSCQTDSIADLQYTAVKCLGLPVVRELAVTKGWTVQQAVAMIGLYLGKSQNGGSSNV
jgi:hypothetical protein